MQFKTLIIAALAATVAAERVPYKLARKSQNLVALARRQDPGYQPEQTFCGEGETCAEACGTGYEQCASTDGLSHCYNEAAGETCCQDDNGNACEADYYCAVDTNAETWCCPDSMDAAACAAAYNVDGGLETQTPSASASSTSAAPTSDSTGSSHKPSNGTAVVTAPSSPSSTGESEPETVPQSGAGALMVSGAGAAVLAAIVAFL